MQKNNSLKIIYKKLDLFTQDSSSETPKSNSPPHLNKLSLSPQLKNPLSSDQLSSRFKYTNIRKLDLTKTKPLITNRSAIDPVSSLSSINNTVHSGIINESSKQSTIEYLEKYTHRLQGFKISQASTTANVLIEIQKLKDVDSKLKPLREQAKEFLNGKQNLTAFANLQVAVEYLSKTVNSYLVYQLQLIQFRWKGFGVKRGSPRRKIVYKCTWIFE